LDVNQQQTTATMTVVVCPRIIHVIYDMELRFTALIGSMVI